MKQNLHSQNNSNGKLISYRSLQEIIDKLIGRYGLPETYQILQDTYHAQNPGLNLDYCKANIIIGLSMEVFSISPKMLKEGVTEKSKKARASSFRLLKMHTGLSDEAIANYFNSGLTRDKIRYARKSAEEVVELPKIDYPFASLIEMHSSRTIEKLNNAKR